MTKDHRAPEAGRLPKAWTGGHEETESRQKASDEKSPQLDNAE